jgi:hypothetical protein
VTEREVVATKEAATEALAEEAGPATGATHRARPPHKVAVRQDVLAPAPRERHNPTWAPLN